MGAGLSSAMCFFNNFGPIVGGYMRLSAAKTNRIVFAGATIKATVGLRYCWGYLFRVWVIYMRMGFTMLFVLPFALTSMILPKQTAYLRRFALSLATCRGGARAWYLTGQHHAGNRHKRGTLLCACPCPPGFVPDGALCRRASGAVPQYSAAAAVTRLYESLDVAGARGVLETNHNVRQVEAYRQAGDRQRLGLSQAQLDLVDAVCTQVAGYVAAGKGSLRGLCYEHACAQGRRSPLCSSAAFGEDSCESDAAVVTTLIRILMLALVSTVAVVWMQAKIATGP